MFSNNDKWTTNTIADKVAWENTELKTKEEKDFERRKVEALEMIAESLESIRSAQWIR